MTTGRFTVQVGVVLMSVVVVMIGTGCTAKRVASNSGDQSMTTKDKGGVETVREDQVASVQTPSPGGESRGQDRRGGQPAPTMPGSGSIPSSSAPAGATAGAAATAADVTGLGDIFFDFDRYNIRTDEQPALEGDARWLRNEQRKALLIEGHCDERGTLAYNLVLGEKRAKAAKRYLEDLGIPASRLLTTSYGKEKPFCKDHNEGCWSKNRRAHFVVQ